ncbi:MAG: 3-methyl-2-oxobutanoate hydroxymethyltransferase [Candidatus Omnitrophica bacterium]|nr:3-methyl-2-oxobutanoate hydroxymethyltransferase [Candidatus Omnitrophota bacterium]MCB9720781.1 3-methyl-2-oxobutanoate hydroxymethyltransferase [Candidatus Omnitrophota bacterium]
MGDKEKIADFAARAKQEGRKITMVAAYDYAMARLIDRSHVDMILVGDSLANVMLGLESTVQVGMEEMIHHAKAVCRGAERAPVIGDMPLGSYATDTLARKNARRFIDEAGCDAVKLEWFVDCPAVASKLTADGISVMGHIGLTPQTAERFVVQGKDAASAQAIRDQAAQLSHSGCFALVLECVPAELARTISREIPIPTIGIGAGVHCDGQVLVAHDLLGLYDRFHPKFVKRYAALNEEVVKALDAYAREVAAGEFPGPQHSYNLQAKTPKDQSAE